LAAEAVDSLAHKAGAGTWAPRAAAPGVVAINGRAKSRALRDLEFYRDPRCYIVLRSIHSDKWLMVGFSPFATGRFRKCHPFDAIVIAAQRGGVYQWVVTDTLRNGCKAFELDLFRAGAPFSVVQDLREAKGCRSNPS